MTRGDPPNVKPGDRLDLTVEKPVYRGQGLARHEGRVVLVGRAVAGDRVRVRVREVRPGYATAAAEERLESAPGRREPPCPFFGACGGCSYQDLDYAAQRALKEAVLRDALARAGAPWDGPLAVRASPESGWRLRASLHVAAGDGPPRLGLFEEGSHRVVDLERCLQLSEGMNRAQRAVQRALGAHPGWARRVRALDLLESVDGAQLVATLATDLAPREAPSLRALAAGLPWLTGLGVLTGRGPRARFLPLGGTPHVENEVLGVRFRTHAQSFFQSNRFLVDELARTVAEMLPAGGRVLDLYAGVGLFALTAARRADRVTALEANPFAATDAEHNARRARLQGVEVRRAEVGAALRALPAAAGERVILDPPRTGAGPGVVEAVAARRPAVVVYVSCDPPTLGRDLALFAARGYRPDALAAFDLFPDTFHLETVARLVTVQPSS
jgi:23S rRNA (uracil1939-C5)-methyltransferase